MTDQKGPAEYAADIDAARQRLLAFAERCSDQDWAASPLDGDRRPVGVVLDHVAHSYEYLAGWDAGHPGRPAGRGERRHRRHAQRPASHRTDIEAALQPLG